jgi:hypothetical protein
VWANLGSIRRATITYPVYFNGDQSQNDNIFIELMVISWENSLEGPQTNDTSFYSSGKLRRPYLTLISFSFPSMALPLHVQLSPS